MPIRTPALVEKIENDVKTMIRIKNQVQSFQNSRSKLPSEVRLKLESLNRALTSLQHSYIKHASSALEKKLTKVYKNTLTKTRKRTARR